MSNAPQYYHARERPDETPLEYLHRLIGATMVNIRDGRHAARREHVEYFISTLDNRDLAKQLTLLQLLDADDMKGTLRAYQRMQNDTRRRQCNRVSFISDRNLTLIKYRQNKPEQYKQSGWKAREAVRSRSQVYRKMTVIGAGFVRSTPPIK